MIPISKPFLGEEEVVAIGEVLRSGWISQGPKVADFERAFADFVGSKYACAVSNCTAALHLALLSAGVQSGDAVITVSYSFIATANAIRYCGAEPLFVDINPYTFNMDPSALSLFIEERCYRRNNGSLYLRGSNINEVERRIAAVLVVHQIGLPCDLSTLLAIANLQKLPVIEDAACAIGSELSFDSGKTWERVGRPRGIAACFSFHPRKILSTGEGGMITTNDSDLDKQYRLLRQHGMTVNDLERHQATRLLVERYDALGYNYRMTDIQAAVGLEQLKKMPYILDRRRQIEACYRRKLAPLSWLALPNESLFARSNWQSYAVRVLASAPKSRDAVMQALFDQGVMSKPGIMNAHQEKIYFESTRTGLLESERARNEVILLPFFLQLQEGDITHIAHVLSTL